MAAFNKAQNEAMVSTGIGISTASQGYDGTDALGKLFAGLGNTLTNTLNAYDTQKKTEIELDAFNEVERAVEGSTPTPQAVTQSVQGVNSLKAARDQGVISEVEFRTKLAATSKSMRANLPAGYAPLVDRAISSALGSSTANDLRIARLQEIEANQSATDRAAVEEAKNRREFQESNLEIFGDPTFQKAYRQATGSKTWVAGDDYDYGTGAYLVSQFKTALFSMDSESKAIDLAAKKKQVNQDQVGTEARRQANHAMNRILNGDAGVQKLAEDMADPNVLADPVKIKELEGALRSFEAKALEQLTTMMADPNNPVFANMTKEQRVAILDESKERIGLMKQFYTDPNLGKLKSLEREWTLQDRVSDEKWKTDNPASAKVVRMGRLGVPQNIIDTLVTGQLKTRVTQEMLEETSMDVFNGDLGLGDAVKKVNQNTSVSAGTENTAGAVVENAAKALMHPKLDDKVKADYAKRLFSKDSSFLASIKEDQRLGAFLQFANPEVRRIVNMDPEAKAAHAEWMTRQFFALSAIPKNTLYQAKENAEAVELSFDAEKMQFVYDSKPYYPLPGSLMGTVEGIKANQAEVAVNTMNRYLGAAAPVWEDNNYDKKKLLQSLFSDFNKIEYKGNMFSQMGKSVYDYFAREGTEADTKTPSRAPQQKSETNPIKYSNKSATRDKSVTPELESKLATAVTTVFGEGYTAEVFSGGQDVKGKGSKRTGSIRHDDGKAADVYIIGPDGKRVTDTKTLDKLKAYWLANDMGSVGTYMKGAGMHLDEWTKEELLAGMGQTWNY